MLKTLTGVIALANEGQNKSSYCAEFLNFDTSHKFYDIYTRQLTSLQLSKTLIILISKKIRSKNNCEIINGFNTIIF